VIIAKLNPVELWHHRITRLLDLFDYALTQLLATAPAMFLSEPSSQRSPTSVTCTAPTVPS
jgi:hypothetical protein